MLLLGQDQPELEIEETLRSSDSDNSLLNYLDCNLHSNSDSNEEEFESSGRAPSTLFQILGTLLVIDF